jgi:DNA adenine methylase
VTEGTLQPPLTYFGGKTRLARRIALLLPGHQHYVEPFAGSLAVLLAKAPSRLETVSDLDGDLMLFWRLLRDRPLELARACALTPHARAEHQAAYELPDDLDDLERARRVWVQLTQGRMGVRTRTGWRCYIDPAGTSTSMPGYLSGYVDRIGAVAERLHNVSLESRPALQMINEYGRSPHVLIYADPPYLGSTRAGGRYQHEMLSDEEHEELAAALRACRAAVVLSGYRSPLYERLYTEWDRVEIPATTGQGGTRQGGSRWCGPTGPSAIRSWSPTSPTPNTVAASHSGSCAASQRRPSASTVPREVMRRTLPALIARLNDGFVAFPHDIRANSTNQPNRSTPRRVDRV